MADCKQVNQFTPPKKPPTILGMAVEDKSIQDFPIYRKNIVDPVNWLADVLQVSGGSGELLRVSLKNDEPQGLKEIVDAVIAAFDREVIERARSEKLPGPAAQQSTGPFLCAISSRAPPDSRLS